MAPLNIVSALGKQDLHIADPYAEKIDSELNSLFETEDFVHVLVRLKEQVDTQRVAGEAKAQLSEQTTTSQQKMVSRLAVVEALRENALKTQGPILECLESER